MVWEEKEVFREEEEERRRSECEEAGRRARGGSAEKVREEQKQLLYAADRPAEHSPDWPRSTLEDTLVGFMRSFCSGLEKISHYVEEGGF